MITERDFQRFLDTNCPREALVTYLSILSFDFNPKRPGIIHSGQETIGERVGLTAGAVKVHVKLLKAHKLIALKRRYRSSALVYIRGRCREEEWFTALSKSPPASTLTNESLSASTSNGVKVDQEVDHSTSEGLPPSTNEVDQGRPQNSTIEASRKREVEASFSHSQKPQENTPERLADIQARAINDLLAKEPEMAREDAIDLLSQKAERRQATILAEQKRRRAQEEEAERLSKNPNELAAKLPKQLRQAYLSRQKKIP